LKTRFELTRFARAALLATVGRSIWLIPVVVLGAVALEIAANLVYDMVIADPFPTGAKFLRVLLLEAILVASAYGFFLLDRRRAQELDVGSKLRMATIAPHCGLIWLLSPGKMEPLLITMRHHTAPDVIRESRLHHCWIIVSDAARKTFDELDAEMQRHGLGDVKLHPVHLTAPDIEQTYRAVSRIYEDHLEALDLLPSQVATDVTGGLKTMTAGALLACLPQDRPVEYLLSQRDQDTGEPIPGSERPVQVNLSFFVQKAGSREGEEGM
jgi:hypothetical protein